MRPAKWFSAKDITLQNNKKKSFDDKKLQLGSYINNLS